MFQAPQTTQTGQQPQGQATTGTPPGFDPEFFESIEGLKQQNDQLMRANRETREGFSALQKDVTRSKDFQQRMLEAVAPELASQNKVDPTESVLSDIDNQIAYYGQVALTPEGQKIKMTLLNKIENLELQRENLVMKRDSSAQLKKMQEQIDYITNPEVQVDRTMYAGIENMMLKGLETLYAGDKKMIDIQLKSMRAYAIDVLSEARDTPKGRELINEMRRDQGLAAKFVNGLLEKTLPPSVVSRLKEERIMNEPITMQHLERAHAQAMRIEDPEVREEAVRQIRWKYYELRNDPKQKNRR